MICNEWLIMQYVFIFNDVMVPMWIALKSMERMIVQQEGDIVLKCLIIRDILLRFNFIHCAHIVVQILSLLLF